MKPLLGFILIDPQEIVITIYQSVEENNWHLLYKKHYQLSFADGNLNETAKVLEVIANVFADVTGLGVGEWEIFSRNMEKPFVADLELALKIKIEELTIEDETEWIMQGILAKQLKHKT